MVGPEWLAACVPIAKAEAGVFSPTGAGVLVHDAPVVWLVTAGHVVASRSETPYALIPKLDGGVAAVELGTEPHGVEWVRDTAHDIAARLVPLPEGHSVKAVSFELFANDDDLVASMPCYCVGCPYGLTGFDPNTVAPMVLDGTVSGIARNTRSVVISTPTFPGNSGGPLLVVRLPFNPMGAPTVLLGGIMREAATVAPATGGPELRLGLATSAAAVRELLHGEHALRQKRWAERSGRAPSP
ncbi:MAG: trypsin-like peptidase domain-containing protein [Deltaproteobacteria bacterium]|nr:trypsin-like peptidase domain-containing protein [Deltaproteobacteria bacterium]